MAFEKQPDWMADAIRSGDTDRLSAAGKKKEPKHYRKSARLLLTGQRSKR